MFTDTGSAAVAEFFRDNGLQSAQSVLRNPPDSCAATRLAQLFLVLVVARARVAGWTAIRLICRGFVALAVCAAPLVLHAADRVLSEPVPCNFESHAEPLSPANLPGVLAKQLSACESDPVWLARAGALLNQVALYLEAVEYLERALMLAPDSPEIRLEYALALAASGDELSAVGLIQALLIEPDLPAGLRGELQRSLVKLGRPQQLPGGRSPRLFASVRLGHDSNLLGAPNLRELALNFGGALGPIILPLDPTYLRQPGEYLRTEAGLLHAQQSGATRWQVWALARDRHSSSVASARVQQLMGGGEIWHGSFYGAADLMRLQAATGVEYETETFGAGVGRPLQVHRAGCQASGGLKVQNRNIRSAPILSGRYAGINVQMHCNAVDKDGLKSGSAPASMIESWLVELNLGQDRAVDNLRAGGLQQEMGIRTQLVSRPLALGASHLGPNSNKAQPSIGQWLLELEAVKRQDQRPYSVFFGDVVRQLTTLAARLEWQTSVASLPGWKLQLGLQGVWQQSNLALFELRSSGPYLALGRVW
jgi:tetratricopeptide (TPR) repeat protein